MNFKSHLVAIRMCFQERFQGKSFHFYLQDAIKEVDKEIVKKYNIKNTDRMNSSQLDKFINIVETHLQRTAKQLPDVKSGSSKITKYNKNWVVFPYSKTLSWDAIYVRFDETKIKIEAKKKDTRICDQQILRLKKAMTEALLSPGHTGSVCGIKKEQYGWVIKLSYKECLNKKGWDNNVSALVSKTKNDGKTLFLEFDKLVNRHS